MSEYSARELKLRDQVAKLKQRVEAAEKEVERFRFNDRQRAYDDREFKSKFKELILAILED